MVGLQHHYYYFLLGKFPGHPLDLVCPPVRLHISRVGIFLPGILPAWLHSGYFPSPQFSPAIVLIVYVRYITGSANQHFQLVAAAFHSNRQYEWDFGSVKHLGKYKLEAHYPQYFVRLHDGHAGRCVNVLYVDYYGDGDNGWIIFDRAITRIGDLRYLYLYYVSH